MKRTHCKRGHEYTPENTYHGTHPNGSRFRMCKACKRGDYQRKKLRQTGPSEVEVARRQAAVCAKSERLEHAKFCAPAWEKDDYQRELDALGEGAQ